MVKLIIQGNICAFLFCVDIPKWSRIVILGVLYFKSGIEEEKKKKRNEEREENRSDMWIQLRIVTVSWIHLSSQREKEKVEIGDSREREREKVEIGDSREREKIILS